MPAGKDHLRKLSGFTGSSGYAVVRPDDSAKGMFVTDSRYEIAVKSEVDTAAFDVSTKADAMVAVLEKMAKDSGVKLKVGLDGHLFTKTQVNSLKKSPAFELIVQTDDRPVVELATTAQGESVELSTASSASGDRTVLIDHELKYAGLSRELKLSKVLQSMQEAGIDTLFVGMLEEISWLLNVKATGQHDFDPLFNSALLIVASKDQK